MKNIISHKNIQVEKIGGVCMSQMDVLLQNVFINFSEKDLIRIFVVSAYSGVTDLLIGSKDGTKDGVLQVFDKGGDWEKKIEQLLSKLLEINLIMEKYGLPLGKADRFIIGYVESVCEKIRNLSENSQQILIKEYLSSLGEVHSAYTCCEILKSKKINAVFVNLVNPQQEDFESYLKNSIFNILQMESVIPIITGYSWFPRGMVETYGRGYSEITFAKIFQIINGSTAIIHKQYPICRIDPQYITYNQKMDVLKYTTYQSLLLLQDTEMQVIHPIALKKLSDYGAKVQVQSIYKNFQEKTTISNKVVKDFQKIEVISGYKHCFYLQFCTEEDARYFLQRLKEENHFYLYANRNCVLVKEKNLDLKNATQHTNVSVQKVSWITGIGSYNNLLDLQQKILSIEKEERKKILVDSGIEEGKISKIHLIIPIGTFYKIISHIQEYLSFLQSRPTRV